MNHPRKNRISVYLPVLLSLALVAGLIMGVLLSGNRNSEPTFQLTQAPFDKVKSLVDYIREEYVDEISPEELEDRAVESLLSELDPHSSYIPASDLAAVSEPLKGNFEGIGIEFNIQHDTIVVITAISGGPSERAGLQAGDRIIEVDGKNVAGVEISNADVTKILKGPKNTKVALKIMRYGSTYDYTITRGTIPINSVEVSMMTSPDIGYIKISRFSRTTVSEFISHSNKLLDQGMKKMILDLRGNGGGLLDAAIRISDEFLDNRKPIVYTEGKSRPRTSFNATRSGNLEGIDLAILIDEGSASASEILAGAIQDNDRGVVIGRRSFGKGLVQEQVVWPDGSAVRLTIARYYTPSGRSIQKPYDDGSSDYYAETWSRMERGEFYSADSIHFPDSLKYYTKSGRTVYGGGGIMPDVFVPYDTSYNSGFLNEVFNRGMIYSFAFEYADNNRAALARYKSPATFESKFTISDRMYSDFVTYARSKGVAEDFAGSTVSAPFIKNRLKALIARHIWNDAGYYTVSHNFDRAFQKAMEFLGEEGYMRERLASLEDKNKKL